jgi:formylglycine-generating enzyme required for sulfatase activity
LFAKETNHNPGLIDADKAAGQTPANPVVNITRADAIAYCKWLTGKERKEGYLPEHLEYRLPTDVEWSWATGVNDDDLLPDPVSRHNRLQGIYPWDPEDQYPPPDANVEEGKPASANLGDLTALNGKALHDLTPQETQELKVRNYDDGYAYTAPVGQFRASKGIELFDLSGNVWEFVSDDFGDKGKDDPKKAKFAVTRGASWAEPVTKNSQWFYTQFRRAVPPEQADPKTGFRIVLAPAKPTP